MGTAPRGSIPCNGNHDDDDCNHLPPKSLSLHYHSHPCLHHQCVTTIRAHACYVAALAVHGTSVYSGGSDQEIRVWPSVLLDSSSTARTDHPASFTVAQTESPVKSLLVSGDNLFSSHQDGEIRVWQINQREQRCYKLKAVLPTSMDRFLSFLSPKNYVQVRRHKKCSWVHHVDAVSGLALSHDGALLYSISWDRTLKVWRTSGFRCIESVAGAHQDAINAIAVSRNGHVYTGSADAKINVWRRSGEEGKHSLVQTLERHRSAVNALALSADDRVLYSGASDRSVVVWEGGSGGMAATGELRGHRRAILCLVAAGDVVCSGSADTTVRVWRRGREQKGRHSCLAVMEGHGGPVKSLAMVVLESSSSSSSSTCLVLSGGLDCDLKLWRLSVPSLS
ncbi:protein JINGUBANG-like [Musa acuminata AAA Group]|uniref:protein JINGUBANG-like n=1 Tax=Musa acuminata AAA Group TaxID=214697 RepID=UPI0031D79DB4